MREYMDWKDAGNAYLEFFGTDTDSLRRELLDPLLIENINPAGKAILDLGCGEGYFTRLLKTSGAKKVIGVDISGDLVNLAKEQDREGEYRIFNAETDEVFSPDFFDALVANLMLMDISNLAAVFRKVKDFLKPSGIFAASIVNPYYAYPVGVWKRNPREFFKGNFRPVLQIRNYFSTGKASINMPETKYRMPHFHRKFSDYIHQAATNEFRIEKLIEPAVPEGLKEKYKNTFLSHQLSQAPLFQILILRKTK